MTFEARSGQIPADAGSKDPPAGGCIVQVWFETESELTNRRARFLIIETELPDFATFCELVEADRFIGGAILWTRKSSGGAQEITKRVPCGFRGSAVLRCQLPTWRFVEG